MDVYKKNVQNTANEHETSKSENTNEAEDAECLLCQETYLNSSRGARRFRFISCSKWAHEESARVDTVINDDCICDFCSRYISVP
jgi:hypothetical protein